MRKSLIYFLIYLFFCSTPVFAGNVLVSIFNEYSLSAIVISPDKGKYVVMAEGKELFVVDRNELVYVSMIGDNLILRYRSGTPGIFSNITLVALEDGGVFRIRPVEPSLGMADYFGDLHLSVDYERIKAINIIDEDRYLAGVVEAESGNGAHLMFYKAHAIISRTYLYGNIERHDDEGFHLCDEVHCQVYKGRLTANRSVYEAVKKTSGMVIVHNDSVIITAAYHANCGGQTVNSEEVWLVYRPYLRSVHDQYCLGKSGAHWQITVNTEKWESYIAGILPGSISGRIEPQNFRFSQPVRTVNYYIEGFPLPLRKIRGDWNLRSAFFSIEPVSNGQQLLFRGRGFGHGVGLCQEGAMEMASRGYNFVEILQFYYTNITVKDAGNFF